MLSWPVRRKHHCMQGTSEMSNKEPRCERCCRFALRCHPRKYDTTQLESLAFRILAKRFSCVESGCSNTFRTKQFLNLSHRSLPSAAHKMLTGSPLQFANFCLLFQHVVCAARKIGNKGLWLLINLILTHALSRGIDSRALKPL